MLTELERPEGQCIDITSMYLKELGKEPLLTALEEFHHAKLNQDGNKESRQILIERNTRLVVPIASKFRGKGVEFIDLISEGNLGLLRAAQDFKPDRGFRFNTYAAWWIYAYVSRASLMQPRIIHIPMHVFEKLRVLKKLPSPTKKEEEQIKETKHIIYRSYETIQMFVPGSALHSKKGNGFYINRKVNVSDIPFESEDTFEMADKSNENNNPENIAQQEENKNSLEYYLSRLSAKQSQVLKSRFGFYECGEKTLLEIGADLKLTRERIRQIEHKAIKLLREKLKRDGLTIQDFGLDFFQGKKVEKVKQKHFSVPETASKIIKKVKAIKRKIFGK